MPSHSLYPEIEIPKVDLWAFLFERKEKPFPDDKGHTLPLLSICTSAYSSQ